VNYATSGNQYASLVAQTNPSTSSTANTATVNCFGTLSNFQVTLSGAPFQNQVGDNYVFNVRVNNADSTLTCTIANLATTCTAAGPITVFPGDTVNVEATPNSAPTARSATWSSTFTQPSVPIG
jgi:hypothetical protein